MFLPYVSDFNDNVVLSKEVVDTETSDFLDIVP
jgi:hypothetical protein